MTVGTFTIILGHYIFFGSMLAIIQAVVSISFKANRQFKILYSLLMLLTGIMILEHYITMYLKVPFILDHFTFSTLILYFIKFLKPFGGPVLFLYIKSLTHIQFKFRKIYLIHFVPGLLTELYIISSYLLLNRYSLTVSLFNFVEPLHNILLVHLFIYIIFTLQGLFTIWKNLSGKMFKQLIYGLMITSIILISIIILSLNVLWGEPYIETIAPVLISTLIIIIYIIEQKFPDVVREYNREIKKARYIKSNIKKVNKSTIEIRLKELMAEEKLYCDEELSLKILADHIMLTPHQLSEFLNSHLKQNFKTFINSYRVNEVKNLLLDYPDRSITHIAFSSGFNSLSGMYKSFSNATGISPGEFRKKNLNS